MVAFAAGIERKCIGDAFYHEVERIAVDSKPIGEAGCPARSRR
jgi:hypothetical protein